MCRIGTLPPGICTSSALWKLSRGEGEINILEAVGWGEVGTDNNCSLDELLQISGASVQLSPFTFAKTPDGHTKRHIKKGLYIHIHWLASINGTYTDELDAAESAGHQSDADALSSSLNTLQTSSAPSSSGESMLAGSRPPGRWAPGFMVSCTLLIGWRAEESRSCDSLRKERVKDDKHRGLLFFVFFCFFFLQHTSVMQFCTFHVTFMRLWADI